MARMIPPDVWQELGERQRREDAHFSGPEWRTLGTTPRSIDEATAAVLALVGIVLAVFGAGVVVGRRFR